MKENYALMTCPSVKPVVGVDTFIKLICLRMKIFGLLAAG